MAKLYFRYAAMNAGKTAQLLTARHNYHERNMNTWLLKPFLDNRDGVGRVYTRVGLDAQADLVVREETDLYERFTHLEDFEKPIHCIFVDEAQFLTAKQVEDLSRIADEHDVPVLCYGLRSDFRGKLFPGSAALLALADSLEELKTVCWCGKKAIMNARIVDGHVVQEGDQVAIGGNSLYTALCRKHWRRDELK